MTDEPQFPQYPKAPSNVATRFAHPAQAKPLLKLMSRALQGKGNRSLFNHQTKRKKTRVV